MDITVVKIYDSGNNECLQTLVLQHPLTPDDKNMIKSTAQEFMQTTKREIELLCVKMRLGKDGKIK